MSDNTTEKHKTVVGKRMMGSTGRSLLIKQVYLRR